MKPTHVLILVAILAGAIAAFAQPSPPPGLIEDTTAAGLEAVPSIAPKHFSGVLTGGDPAELEAVKPPAAYIGDNGAVVIFANLTTVNQICNYGTEVLACTAGELIVLPNPCGALADREVFAAIVCHELGHRNGWPGEHGAK